MRRILAAAGGAALFAAAPADPLLARLLAGAAAVPPPTLRFDRTITVAETTGGKTERHVRVDRWDGRAWSVLSIDGAPPSPRAAAAAVKENAAGGVPGYYRLAAYLAAAPERVSDPAGHVVYRLHGLPPAVMAMKGAPPDKFDAELTVDGEAATPFVRRARYFAPAPMRILLVARLERFEAVADYRLDAAGRPLLTHQTVDLAGVLFGRSGSQHTEYSFTYR